MVSAQLYVPNTALLGERAPRTDWLSLNQTYWALNKTFNSSSMFLTTALNIRTYSIQKWVHKKENRRDLRLFIHQPMEKILQKGDKCRWTGHLCTNTCFDTSNSHPEDGSRILFQNVRTISWPYTVKQPCRLSFEQHLPWKPQNVSNNVLYKYWHQFYFILFYFT